MYVLVYWIAFLLTLWSTPLLMFLSFLITGHPDLVSFVNRLTEQLRGGDE